ncbi:hypothetical protein M0R45_001347 [Rubus argutus]|uniref:Uncharacterized protein n=1 Tax=Rubus argutus TaxID=59490 RepID=A0AAW1VHW5_RUBAR
MRRITAESEPSLGSGNKALGGAAKHDCDVVENSSEHGLERDMRVNWRRSYCDWWAIRETGSQSGNTGVMLVN